MRPEIKMDGHIHTLECGHAYNTITEMANAAKEKGLDLICWTEHGPKMFGSARPIFFRNMRVIPPEINGVRVLKGMESNILDETGRIDANENLAPLLEIISASFHEGCIKPMSKEDNTKTLLKVMENDNVDFLCHLGNPNYPIDYETVVKAAKDHNKLIEINNSSFFVRKGSLDNCVNIAELCQKHQVPIILGSDSHFSQSVGDFDYATKVLDYAGVDSDLVMNYDPQKLLKHLEAKGKNLGAYRANDGIEIFRKYEEEHA